MKEEIRALVHDCLVRESELLPQALDLRAGDNTILYGEHGLLDSLALVSLIVSLEGSIQERFAQTVILADERALSIRRSPFATVGTLCNHIFDLMQDRNA